jgi:hypothetical protein
MESWWELGEWRGHSGNTMQMWRLTCPFCKEQGNFALAHHAEKQKGGSQKKLNFDLYQCLNCMAYVHVFWSAAEHSIGHSLHDFMVLPWPLGKAKPSENWPLDTQRFWSQAHESLEIENWDAAAVMARSAVQVTMRDKGAVGKDLYGEIEDLAAKGNLPPLVKEWSHEVRVLGNDSAHPKPNAPPTTPEDARDIVQFLDSLLMYLYDYPKRISDYRARRNAPKSNPPISPSSTRSTP